MVLDAVKEDVFELLLVLVSGGNRRHFVWKWW